MSNMNESGLNLPAPGKAAVMNQRPESLDVRGESPLHHADLPTLAEDKHEGGITLREISFLGHLTLRCNKDCQEQLAIAENILGLSLPLKPLTSTGNGLLDIRWMSPDEWLITVPGSTTFDIESQFCEKMTGHYSLVNGSGGQTILEISGPSVVNLLKKSTPIDFHPDEFPVGKVVSTIFAKAGATIRKLDEQRFELVIRRSFADYIWLWLQDAAREYGLVVQA